ncbi:MAG TPA: DUF192 domain-containing protein [Vicinamibacterales bacterium]|nr:DUF192 domain-containing protein [Vicinamibacterales bacterium]
MLRALIVGIVGATFIACGAGDGSNLSSRPDASESPSFRDSTVVIETDDGAVLVDAEIADTPEEHAVGLMNRRSLDEDAGMAFVFFEDTSSSFWMKDTLIPLSIAFFDERGRIVRILDMEPCEEEPCPFYDPGVSYRGALEVNQGAFDEWGVEEGDQVRISP